MLQAVVLHDLCLDSRLDTCIHCFGLPGAIKPLLPKNPAFRLVLFLVEVPAFAPVRPCSDVYYLTQILNWHTRMHRVVGLIVAWI